MNVMYCNVRLVLGSWKGKYREQSEIYCLEI